MTLKIVDNMRRDGDRLRWNWGGSGCKVGEPWGQREKVEMKGWKREVEIRGRLKMSMLQYDNT
ncbi:MAG: hypothetical protein V1915_00520 [Candidatus Bathyarchaeota archaeon]